VANPISESPYPLGTVVTDPRLLQSRRVEIDAVLSAVASEQPSDHPHAMIIGEQNSGRTSVLTEVSRRAAEEVGRQVVWLQNGYKIPRDRPRFVRHLLTAIVEALATTLGPEAPWYRAWRNRVYLRNTDPLTDEDLLSSALILAADPDADIDRKILERDLAQLADLALAAGLSGVVVCVDDASPLTEDVRLVEDLVDTFDTIGGYSLLLAGLPSIAGHFTQAASPCIERSILAFLWPFNGQHQAFTALSAPLVGAAAENLPPDDPDLLRDVLQLTGGNPYELMVVGHFLWLSCQLGEQETYALTPRVLDRVIPTLSRLTAEGDALLNGAAAIDQLPEQHMRQAVELVALSRLSVREIAIARLLGVGRGDALGVKPDDILTANLEDEEARVREELGELQDAGVVELGADKDRFRVIGGRQTAVLLKYKARALIGDEASNWPFGRDFLPSTGWALSRDAMLRVLDLLPGGGVGRRSPRPAIRGLAGDPDSIERLIHAEVDLSPWGSDAYERISRLLTVDEPNLALVSMCLVYGGEQLEYMEAWEIPEGVTPTELTEAIAKVVEEWAPVVEAAELKWSGNEHVLLHGKSARRVLMVLHRFAANSAVHHLFAKWFETEGGEHLERAKQVAHEALDTMRESAQSDAELDGEFSGMLSRLGFMESFDDARLPEARAALEEALHAGTADGWVTNWNLANVLARLGESAKAAAQLVMARRACAEWSGKASVVVFVPGRSALNSLVNVTDEGVEDLFELQRLVIDGAGAEELAEPIERCQASCDDWVKKAAGWVVESLNAAPA
jgi:hypothetical protein